PVRQHTKRVLPHDRHPHSLLTRPEVAATVAPATAAPLCASTRERSGQPPSPVCPAATPWPTRCHGWGSAQPETGVRRPAARQRCDTPGGAPADTVSGLRPGRAYGPDASPPPRVGGCPGSGVRPRPY